jgi:hypothetical protein
MNRFDPIKPHAVPRSAAVCDEGYAAQGIMGESIRVGGS